VGLSPEEVKRSRRAAKLSWREWTLALAVQGLFVACIATGASRVEALLDVVIRLGEQGAFSPGLFIAIGLGLVLAGYVAFGALVIAIYRWASAASLAKGLPVDQHLCELYLSIERTRQGDGWLCGVSRMRGRVAHRSRGIQAELV
jgi:hypothetical protein